MEIRAGTTTPTTALATAVSKFSEVGATPVPFTYATNLDLIASCEALCTLTIFVKFVTATSLLAMGLAASIMILPLARPIISAVLSNLATKLVVLLAVMPIELATEAIAFLTKPLAPDSAREFAKAVVGVLDNKLVAMALVSKTV